MNLWRRRRQPKTSYWVNGHGPLDTTEERDQMYAMLREIADHNRRFLEHYDKDLAPSDTSR